MVEKEDASGRSVSRILSSESHRFTPQGLRPCLLASAIIYLCGLPETQMERAAPSPLFDLAPDGGCLAARITADAGGLLRRLFIMTGRQNRSRCTRHRVRRAVFGPSAVLFCGPIRQIAPSRGFPGAVPCGVRTFLDSSQGGAAIAQPA